MDINLRKFVLYVLSVLALSGAGFLIYEYFELHRHHTRQVKIFCDTAYENVGVTNTRSLDLLKDYSHNKVKFEEEDAFKIENFYADTIHIARCSEGTLFSKRYNGARGVKVMINGEEQVITVLTENITFLDGEEE